MASKNTNKRSDNAGANGFSFQYAAALAVFLENMAQTDCFGIEAEDDIEFRFRNGSSLYAQAKSSLEADRIADTHFQDIYASIETLSEHNNSSKLISIFNYFQPFGLKDAFPHSEYLSTKSFDDLTTKVQEKMQSQAKAMSWTLDFDKLEFWYLRFEGRDKYQSVKWLLREKLQNIDVRIDSNAVMNDWLHIIENNASDKEQMVNADVMVGALFAGTISDIDFDDVCDLLGAKERLSFPDKENLKKQFNRFVEAMADNFVFTAKLEARTSTT